LNITYSKKKQEFRHDPVMEWLAAARDWLVKNSTLAASVTLGAVFILVIAAVTMTVRRSGLEKASEAFGSAMAAYAAGNEQKAVELLAAAADNYKGTPQGAYSAYLIGTIMLNEDRFDEAIEWLLPVSSRRDAGFVPAAAREALATAYEGKGDLDNALKYNEMALNDKRITYRHPAIRWKLALINKELKKFDLAETQCTNILSDSLATAFHSRARQLLAEMHVSHSRS